MPERARDFFRYFAPTPDGATWGFDVTAAGDATLDDMAEQLGFSSAFHLSAAFKRNFGVSPQHWRQKLRGGVSASPRPAAWVDSDTNPRRRS